MRMLDLVKGIGDKTKAILESYGIVTLSDLVHYYPKRYETYFLSTLNDAEETTARWYQAIVKETPKLYKVRSKLTRMTVRVTIEDKEFTVAFFNQNYLMHILYKDTKIALKAKINPNIKSVNGLQLKRLDNFREGIVPIYNIEGVSDHKFLQFVSSALALTKHQVEENIPK